MAVAELIETRADSGFVFPDKLVEQDTPTARHYDALLRGMTHKLNNLLAVIQGFSSLVLMQEGLDEMSTENVHQMKEAAGSASDLGERILPAAGCSRVELAELELRKASPILINRLRSRVESANLACDVTLGESLPTIIADQDRLRLILDELVANAVEAAGPHGEVRLAIENRDGRVSFRVTNTGPEIAPENLREIFKPFYTTKDNTRLGIGLTTAHVLAGNMKMDLGVRSGNGETCFELSADAA